MGYSPWGHHESVATERLHFHFSLSRNGEGNGNPLQCSCLENPRDGRAWWAAVYGVAQSQTRLKRLSSRIGGMPSVVPVSLGCCEHNKVGTEQEENEGTLGPLSLSTTTCSPMTVLHFPIPRAVLSLDSHSLEHTEQDALGNMSPTSDGNRGPFWH